MFRQELGVSRTVGRRLIGSLFEAPEFVDGGLQANAPKVDINGDGVGISASQANDGQLPVGAWLTQDHFQPAGLMGGGEPGRRRSPRSLRPTAATSRSRGGRATSPARATRTTPSTAFGPEFTISNPGLGPVIDPGVMVGGDRLGDFAVAMVQGTPGAYALTGAVYDRAPGAPFIEETENYKRKTRPLLRWRPGLDLWGPQRFRVYIDGQVAAETTVDAYTPRVPLAAGKHTWQIEAIDGRGQTSRSRLRTLRIDSIAPTLSVKVTGKRVANQNLKIVVRAKDTGGAGLDHITVDYGDKSAKSSTARRATATSAARSG